MKNLILLLIFTCTHLLIFSQPNTEVFLFDLNTENEKFELSNFKNISNNEGYDNQPSFLDDNIILFASTRNGQTDIARYSINYDSKIWLNHTEGSEYSPLKIPNQNAVSAIRLDKDGKQLLYNYSLRNGESSVLIEDLVIGYHVWLNNNTVLSSVLDGNNLSLYSSNINTKTNLKLEENIGRSLHKIPNSNLISFVSKKDSLKWKIKSLNPVTGAIKHLKITLNKAEDYCWLPNGTLIMGKDDKLYKYKPKRDSNWIEVASLSDFGIKNISRLAISPNGKKLAVVGEGGKTENESEVETETSTSDTLNKTDAGEIVQKHIKPYNNGDLNAFANAFSENVIVSKFPNKKMYQGRQQLKQNYSRFFKNNKNLSVRVNNRIILKNMVIDEEIVTVNHGTNRHVTVYKTSDKGIETMTFINNSNTKTNPEIIVDKQLEAYNKKDIDAFMATYSKDIKLYDYPEKLKSEGQKTMRESYEAFFKRTPDLRAFIKKRIVIGNKVIDEEQVTINGKIYNAVAIYEIENGLISKVTFIQ